MLEGLPRDESLHVSVILDVIIGAEIAPGLTPAGSVLICTGVPGVPATQFGRGLGGKYGLNIGAPTGRKELDTRLRSEPVGDGALYPNCDGDGVTAGKPKLYGVRSDGDGVGIELWPAFRSAALMASSFGATDTSRVGKTEEVDGRVLEMFEGGSDPLLKEQRSWESC